MTPERRARLRRWAERAVLVIGALAIIATSPARWSLDAKAPPGSTPSPQALLITVEASQAPQVQFRRSGEATFRQAPPLTPGVTWPGRAQFPIPPDATLDNIFIDGRCTGGFCSPCTAPPGAHIAILRLDPAGYWTLRSDSAKQTVTLEPSKPGPTFDVSVDASRPPEVQVLFSGAPPGVYASAYVTGGPPDAGTTRSFRVDWYTDGTLAAPLTLDFTVRAAIEGYCPGGTECRPTSSDTVNVVAVTPR